jgi:hypothetical protein
MCKMIISALAAAIILSGGLLGDRAEAMTVSAPGVASAQASLVEKAGVVCSGNGCAPVQTKRVKRRPLSHI